MYSKNVADLPKFLNKKRIAFLYEITAFPEEVNAKGMATG
jgi:hypothetical protein